MNVWEFWFLVYFTLGILTGIAYAISTIDQRDDGQPIPGRSAIVFMISSIWPITWLALIFSWLVVLADSAIRE